MIRFTDIRPQERLPAAAGFSTLLGITAGHTLMETARDAIFLARLPVSRLAWVYLAIAAIGLLVSRLGAGKGGMITRYAVALSLVVAAGVTALFWLLSATAHVSFVYALYVWTGVFASWVVVRTWTALGQMFDVAQAKRLYGVIGAGAVLGAVVGASVARALTTVLPARHLLLASAALFLLTAMGPAVTFARAFPDDASPPPSADTVSMADAEIVREQPYISRILRLVLVSTVAVTLVDYLFKGAVAHHVPHEKLGMFFSTFNVVLSLLALVTQLFGVSPLLRVVGVHRALWIFPILLVFGTSGVLVIGGLLASVFLKGIDGTFRYSLHRTTMELLLVPVPDGLRRRAKPFLDLIGTRGGQAIASLLILSATQLDVGRKALEGAVLLLIVYWLVTAVALRQHYLDLFRSALRRGALVLDGSLPPLDLDALETLFGALNSQRDDEVVAALDLLAAQERAKLIPALILYHPSPSVVLRALELMVEADRRDFVPIADRLLVHTDAAVRAAALRARTTVMPDEALLQKHAQVHVIGFSDELRATALVGLARNGWMPKEEARETMLALAESPSMTTRLAIARAVRAQVHPDFEDALLALARSPEPQVLVYVVAALAQIPSPRALPLIVPMLAMRQARSAVRSALRAMGEPARLALAAALVDPEVPMAVRAAVPRALADMEPGPAAAVLVDALIAEEDGMMRFRILRALGRLRRTDPKLDLDKEKLIAAGRRNVMSALRYVDWQVALEQGARDTPERWTAAHELMMALLKDKEQHAIERIFRVMGLYYPGEDFERIFLGLKSADPKARASSRELIENVIESPARELTLILVDEAPAIERLTRVGSFYTRDTVAGYDGLLARMREAGGETLAALAEYHASELGVAGVRDHVHVAPPSSRFVEDVVDRARSLAAVPPLRRPAHG